MIPITDPTRIEHCSRLVREMMLLEEGRECEFDPDWVRQHGWKVVPIESAMRLPDKDIPVLVSALKRADYTECVAVFNEPGYIRSLPLLVASEPPSDTSTCHLLSIDEVEFREFNREL